MLGVVTAGHTEQGKSEQRQEKVRGAAMRAPRAGVLG